MIPKIIHYCWFGKKDKTDLAKKCIASWKEKLPDYQIIEWNEDNFDVKKLKFTREAYKIGKYAFVADVARLYALYNFGGIYLDTDVEVIKTFDDFLDKEGFIGYEDNRDLICLQTAVIGSCIGNPLIEEFLDYYKDKSFILKNGEFDITTNVKILLEILKSKNIELNNKYINYNDILHIYPKDFFCPKDPEDNINLTENTVCIHYYSGSWCRVIPKKHRKLVSIIGEELYYKLGEIKKKILG